VIAVCHRPRDYSDHHALAVGLGQVDCTAISRVL
jgi:hypothetical protein